MPKGKKQCHKGGHSKPYNRKQIEEIAKSCCDSGHRHNISHGRLLSIPTSPHIFRKFWFMLDYTTQPTQPWYQVLIPYRDILSHPDIYVNYDPTRFKSLHLYGPILTAESINQTENSNGGLNPRLGEINLAMGVQIGGDFNTSFSSGNNYIYSTVLEGSDPTKRSILSYSWSTKDSGVVAAWTKGQKPSTAFTQHILALRWTAANQTANPDLSMVNNTVFSVTLECWNSASLIDSISETSSGRKRLLPGTHLLREDGAVEQLPTLLCQWCIQGGCSGCSSTPLSLRDTLPSYSDI